MSDDQPLFDIEEIRLRAAPGVSLDKALAAAQGMAAVQSLTDRWRQRPLVLQHNADLWFIRDGEKPILIPREKYVFMRSAMQILGMDAEKIVP